MGGGGKPRGCRRTWLSEAGGAKRLAGWSGAAAAVPRPSGTQGSPHLAAASAGPARPARSPERTAGVGLLTAGSQEEAPAWGQSLDHLRDADGPLNRTSWG